MATPTLPAPPRALAAILEAASDPEVQLDHLAQLVSRDPTFAGLILQVANTAQYRGSRSSSITNLHTATMRLGVRSVRNYALCHAARSCASVRQIGSFDLDRFWEESLRRAVAAELLAEQTDAVKPHEAFTVGLMMELGVVALMMEAPDQAGAWTRIRHAEPDARLNAERSLFGATHADVNVQLVRDWNLPEELGIPLIHHHDPDAAPPQGRPAAALAGVAESLAAVLSSDDKRAALERAKRDLGRLLEVEDERADELIDALGQRVQAAGQVLGIKVGAQPTLEDILQAANRSLVEANLSYEDMVSRLEAMIAEKDALAAVLDQRNRELERLSTTDVLTNLPNRRQLFRRLTEELSRTARHGGTLSMLVVDIDHFKAVNDTWGHVFGDLVLQKVATALASAVRTNDIVARAGGEEFAALLPETTAAGASTLAHRMLTEVADLRIASPSGQPVQVTVSIGLAWIDGRHRGKVDIDDVGTQLYRAADSALYESKVGGRNRVTSKAQAVGWMAGAGQLVRG